MSEFANRSIHAVAIAVVLFVTAPAWAQSSALRTAHATVQSLFDEARFAEALPHAETAVRLSEQEFGPEHLTTATLLVNLAELRHLTGAFAAAETDFDRALSIQEAALDETDYDLARTLSALAATYDAQGRIYESADLHDRALQIVSDTVARRTRLMQRPGFAAAIYRARRVYNRAMQHQCEGNVEEAEWLFRSAQDALEVNAGPDSMELAPVLRNLAILLRATERSEEAAELDTRADAITAVRYQAGC